MSLARHEQTVELLPRNQWGGLSHLPDMVAAFVQPNEPAVERVLKQTAEVLRKHGKNPALDGYRGGSKRAWELTSGLWSAVVAMGLDYALPPASFEHAGQKVRGPGQIAESGLATCLDLDAAVLRGNRTGRVESVAGLHQGPCVCWRVAQERRILDLGGGRHHRVAQADQAQGTGAVRNDPGDAPAGAKLLLRGTTRRTADCRGERRGFRAGRGHTPGALAADQAAGQRGSAFDVSNC